MPSAAAIQRFIARVESGAHADAIEEFYCSSFEFVDGSMMRMDELAYQRWNGERIAEEKFFYDPAQLQQTTPTGS